jgi:glycerophosphoryl diester phosphodiesterase
MICCHRSRLSGRFPANSLAAVRECIEAGAPRIEFDIWFLADDSVLVYHGERLEEETTGRGPVSAQTRESVAGARYAGTEAPIAFLEDIVEAASGTDTILQVDLKGLQALGRERAAMLARALEPVAGQALVGSQAHWNLRYLAEQGLRVALDPMLHFHAGTWPANELRPPWRTGLHGFRDDGPLAHVAGVSFERYLDARLDDLLGLVPAVEWMVDWRTLFLLEERGVRLGEVLAGHGVELAAWTIHDEGPEATLARLGRLFGLGATTVISDAPEALGRYLVGG